MCVGLCLNVQHYYVLECLRVCAGARSRVQVGLARPDGFRECNLGLRYKVGWVSIAAAGRLLLGGPEYDSVECAHNLEVPSDCIKNSHLLAIKIHFKCEST